MIRHPNKPYFLILLFLCITVFGCTNSNSDNHTPQTGDIVFTLSTRYNSETKGSVSKSLNCNEISNIRASINDIQGNFEKTGGPWSCATHSGVLKNIPVGSQYRLVVEAFDSLNKVQYRGVVPTFTVISGRTNNAGHITLAPVEDEDGDGVADDLDDCPDTPEGSPVDESGCPVGNVTSLVWGEGHWGDLWE